MKLAPASTQNVTGANQIQPKAILRNPFGCDKCNRIGFMKKPKRPPPHPFYVAAQNARRSRAQSKEIAKFDQKQQVECLVQCWHCAKVQLVICKRPQDLSCEFCHRPVEILTIDGNSITKRTWPEEADPMIEDWRDLAP